MANKNRTKTVVRMAERIDRKTEKVYDVEESRVEFTVYEGGDFRRAARKFCDTVKCVYPLRDSWVGVMPTFFSWGELVIFFENMRLRVPESYGHRPDVQVYDDCVSYTTASGKGYICATRRDDGTFLIKGKTWQESRKVALLLDELRKVGVRAQVERESV